MNDIKKIIIIGGGPAGLMTAIRMQQAHQISCVVYEVRQKPSSLGGAIGIPSNGLRLLQRLGIYEKVAARGAETNELVVHSLQGGVLGVLDLSSWSKQRTGFGYLRIQRTDLMDVLLESAEAAGIFVHYDKQLSGMEEYDNHITASFTDGTIDTADFLLGCDGIHSSVRKLYVDPDCKPEYSGVANVYTLLPTMSLHPAASLDGLHATLTSDGLFAVTPATPSRDILYWFFSREVSLPASGDDRDGWEERGKAEVAALKSVLINTLGGAESEWAVMLRDVVDKTKALRFYPIYKVPTGRPWFKGRCLIIGDAAHAMPPHASQGVSMALEDLFLFSKLLHSGHNSIEDALQAYEQKRKSRTEQMLTKTEQNGSIRKKIEPWRLWINELAICGGLWAYRLVGLDKLGIGQKHFAYDVEEESFDL